MNNLKYKTNGKKIQLIIAASPTPQHSPPSTLLFPPQPQLLLVLHHDGGRRLLIGWLLAKLHFSFAAVQLHVDEGHVVSVYCDVTSAQVRVLDVADSRATPVDDFLEMKKLFRIV